MKLVIEYELDYYDGPTIFFGTLDGEFVYVEADLSGDSAMADNRTFTYWVCPGDTTLPAALNAPASGQFTSKDVEWKA